MSDHPTTDESGNLINVEENLSTHFDFRDSFGQNTCHLPDGPGRSMTDIEFQLDQWFQTHNSNEQRTGFELGSGMPLLAINVAERTESLSPLVLEDLASLNTEGSPALKTNVNSDHRRVRRRGRPAYNEGRTLLDQRARIEDLYMKSNLTLKEVMETMRTEHGIQTSVHAYKRCFRRWGLPKKTRKDDDGGNSKNFRKNHPQKTVEVSKTSTESMIYRKATSSNFQPVEWLVHGRVAGVEIDGLADTGATINAISHDEVQRLKQTVEQETNSSLILLPNGSTCQSRGFVSLRFVFDGEHSFHEVRCSVVDKLRHGIILGYDFLDKTRTLTTFFKKRIKQVACTSKHRQSLCLLQGENLPSKARMTGFMHGVRTTVVPDTGSNIMAMSLAHSKRLGLKVDESQATKVTFADGSTTITKGVALAPIGFPLPRLKSRGPFMGILDENSQDNDSIDDLEDEYANGTDIEYEWHVIEDLPVDAVLSINFIIDHGIFYRKAHSLDEGSPKPVESSTGEIFGIFKNTKWKPKSLMDDYIADLRSSDPFTLEMEVKEEDRHYQIQEEINSLPISGPAIRQELEDLRVSSRNEMLNLYRAGKDWTAERARWIADHQARIAQESAAEPSTGSAQDGTAGPSRSGDVDDPERKRRKRFHGILR